MDELISQLTTILRFVWRGRWRALAAAWFVSIAGWAFVVTLPDVYESRAEVYVDTANILRPLLQGLAVEQDIRSEVTMMQKTLMSRPNLTKVLQMTDLDVTAKTNEETELLLTSLERRTRVARIGDNLFAISHRHTDATMSRDIVQALLTIFVESNLGANRRDMEAARRFIEQQIAEYENQLEQAELRLARFKQENLNLLYGQVGYQKRREEAEARLAELNAQLRDATLRRDTIQSEIESVPPYLEQNSGQGTGPESDTILRMLELESQLELLLTQYTEEHPDVLVIKRQLAVVEEQLANEQSFAAPAEEDGDAAPNNVVRVANTIYEQLKLQLINQNAEIAALTQRIAGAESAVESLEAMATRVPIVEAELIRLDRDYNVLKSKYEEFLSRREAERISRARQAGVEQVQFRITEPPRVPVLPSGPKRPLFLTMALLVGLGAGGALAVLLGFASNRISTLSELKESLGLPVLGSVSLVKSGGRRARSALGAVALGFGVTGLLASFGALLWVETSVGFGSLALLQEIGQLGVVLKL